MPVYKPGNRTSGPATGLAQSLSWALSYGTKRSGNTHRPRRPIGVEANVHPCYESRMPGCTR